MLESLYFPLVFLAAVVGLGIAGVALRYRSRPGAAPLSVFATTASLWTIIEGLRVTQSGIETMTLWTSVALSLTAVIPPAWLVFTAEYTGNDRRIPNWVYPALLAEPVLFWGLVWTNTDHELVWSGAERLSYGGFEVLALEFGIGFWAHQVYSYVLLAVGALVLLRMVLRTNQLYRWQGTALLLAITLPLTLNALYSFELAAAGIDPSGIGYVLAALVLAVTVFEAELEGVAPATRELGREAVLTELDDAILILNDDGRLIDTNPAGERLLGKSVEDALGQELSGLEPALGELLADERNHAQIELEQDGKRRYYDVRISSLSEEYSMIAGQVVSLRDVTGRRQREQRLDVLNRMLRHNIRNELNLVRGKIELAETAIEDEQPRSHLDDATAAVDGIVARSNKLGRLSQMLDSEQREQIDIATELRAEQDTGGLDFEDGTVDIALPDRLVVSGGSALVAAFEELLSNAIEHNDSPDPHAVIRVDESATDDDHVVIVVSDNGSGIEQQELETILSGRETALQHSSGVGLWLVNWVVERAGGTLSFENDDGCTVRVRLSRP
ncbi:histidine kinase N-terminal 7TM domain-containing protein [Halovenus sp. HT40]|uniref:histidine kinase N-terminal 7TM domain-containing protein n=1 Tax=Halovenus sp. HT40 TaxID=3126691 RepID=UPI00300F361D